MKIILFFMSGGDHGDRSGDRKNRHYPQTWKPKGFRYTQTSPRVIARIRQLAETKQSRGNGTNLRNCFVVALFPLAMTKIDFI